MKPILWVGIFLVVLGVASFFISVPHTEKHGIKVAGASLGVETTTSEKLPPFIGGALILGGALLLITGNRTRK